MITYHNIHEWVAQTQRGAVLDSKAVRGLFPYLAEATYLNTAATGLSWTGQGAAAARFYDEDKSRGYGGREQWRGKLQRTRELVSGLLGVDPQEVSFASSTTEVLNLLAHSVPLKSGDEVVLCADEFPSVILAWSPAALRGAELVTVPVTSERSRTDELIGGITRSTRVVCVSHVHWCTGTRVDLDRIASAARAVGAKVVVDGAHALGAIDVDASVADFYTGSTFKWLLSGFGVAYSMMRQRAAAEIEPVFRGYANEAPSRSLQYSHANYPVMYALEATLELLEGLGWQAIEARVSSLTETVHRGLVAAGWEVVTPMESRAGIISIRDPNAPQTVARLLAERVEVEDRAGHLRVSPHFYNNEADLRRFLDVLGRNPG